MMFLTGRALGVFPLFYCLFTSGFSQSCDLSGSSWPAADWRNVMRGTAIEVCLPSKMGDGRCDISNDFSSGNCQMDGGDCCMPTCMANCVGRQPAAPLTQDQPYYNPRDVASECAYLCGARAVSEASCPYLCLSDDYMQQGSSFTQWCTHTRGTQTKMSECYSTEAQVVAVLAECLKDDRAHGNLVTGNVRCGNQTGDCTLADVARKIDGCHLHPSSCTAGSCCSLAIASGWIDPTVTTLPSPCAFKARCDATCMATIAKCARTNKSCQGGCCVCANSEWFGHNCDQPLCWPRCKHGACVAPNECFCDAGWSGESCEVPRCEPTCVGGQGVCVAPNVCECFYGFSGASCEIPISHPPCVNGHAVAPDVCKCDAGWGGRICDYPLCQSYPQPSADCGLGGVCASPFQCHCAPGWSLASASGTDGMVTVPTFWKGRDTSSVVAVGDFIFGDTRFNQSAADRYLFDEYNAFTCDAPDCKLLVDGRCKACSAETCYECESGYFVDGAGRCRKCALQYNHCRQCDASRCLTCDPMFSLVEAKCVSDGIFEFSSPRYNVIDSEEFVEIFVVRSAASTADAKPVTLLVKTEADTASSGAPGVYSNFAHVRAELTFPDANTWQQSVRIPIFNNVKFDAEVVSFRVVLLVAAEARGGSSQPLQPTTVQRTDERVSQSTVYVWDSSRFDSARCVVEPSFLSATGNYAVGGGTITVPVQCSECVDDGCSAVAARTAASPEVKFALTSQHVSIFVSTATGSYTAGYLGFPVTPPTSSGVEFTIQIEALFSGAVAKHYTLTAVPAPGLVADATRLERRIDQEWPLASEAPPLVVYTGYIWFGCIAANGQLPTQLGVALSQGASATLSLDETEVIAGQRTLNVESTDQQWQAPTENFICADNILCYEQSGVWTRSTVLRFVLSVKPSPLYYARPVGVRLLMRNKDDASDPQPTWKVIPSGCLYGGVDIPESPIRGLQTA